MLVEGLISKNIGAVEIGLVGKKKKVVWKKFAMGRKRKESTVERNLQKLMTFGLELSLQQQDHLSSRSALCQNPTCSNKGICWYPDQSFSWLMSVASQISTFLFGEKSHFVIPAHRSFHLSFSTWNDFVCPLLLKRTLPSIYYLTF